MIEYMASILKQTALTWNLFEFRPVCTLGSARHVITRQELIVHLLYYGDGALLVHGLVAGSRFIKTV